MVGLYNVGIRVHITLSFEWGCRQRQFSALSVATSSETLEIKPALLFGDLQTLNDFE